ncbi:MAG: ABC transporter ATP-binding protein, partial [Flavobacteriaceae bacterium]
SVAALDISVQAQVLNLLNKLKKELNLSYLFISHDLAIVKYMSDRVMVMEKGQLIEIQEADQLYTHPKNEYTQKLIEAIPVLD